MSFEKHYTAAFTLADHHVEAEMETLPGEAEHLLRDMVRRDRYAEAEVTALATAIRKLRIDGKLVFRNTREGMRRVKGNEVQHLPSPREYMDPDTMETVNDRLLTKVVQWEFWLAKKDPFADCFEQYWEEPETVDPQDPPVASSVIANPTPRPPEIGAVES